MELYSRIGKDQMRDRISNQYFAMRDLDHKVKYM